jgi:glycosyltransferase involved in cell wall biosynthesis
MYNKKLVSYCILSYNQEKYIKTCLENVLNQTYNNLEIIISDDNSSDNTWAIIQDILKEYKGGHIVKSYKNEKNLGLALHYSKIVNEIAIGQYIIFLGGDDICMKNHVAIAMNYVNKFSEIMLFDFNGEIIDDKGLFVKKIEIKNKYIKYELDDYLETNSINSFAPGRIINRKLNDTFGAINQNCPTEDSVMVFRSLLIGGIMRVDENLIKYRIHSNNLSSPKSLKRMNNEAIIHQYLTDANLAFSKGLLKKDLYQRVLFRILFQLKLRNLVRENGSFVVKIKRIIYKIFYRFIINF